MSKNPQRFNNEFNNEDYDNYARLMLKTSALHRDNDPKSLYPKSSRSDKWKVIKYILGIGESMREKGVVVIPSDRNALLERLDLLLSSKEAGHTGVVNELVSICYELKRQGVLHTRSYKKLNSVIKNDSP